LEFCALTRGNLRVCDGSNFSSFEDKLQIINGTIIGRNSVVCCLRMTALRPVIVVRSTVQKPATSARGDSARLDRPATVGIVLAPCRTPAAAAPKQPFRPDRRPAIRPSSNGPKRLGVAHPFWLRRQWKRFLPLGACIGEAVLRLERAVDHLGWLPAFGHSIA
jgi:hypothetical protein